MKISALLASFLFLCTIAEAQKKLNLGQQVTLNKNEWPLDELLLEVTRQTGVHFSINTRKFPRTRKLKIEQRTQTVSKLLAGIRKTTGIAYTQVGSHIIMLDQLPPKSTTNGHAPGNHTTTGNKNPAQTKTVPYQATAAAITEPVPSLTDLSPSLPGTVPLTLLFRSPSQTLTEIAALRKAQVKKLLTVRRTQHNPSDTGKQLTVGATSSRSKREYQVFKGFFTQAGSAADDVLYMHNSVMAGHTYAYGIIGYSTNFKQSGLRYGIGGSMPLSSRWNMHLQLSTGKLNFNYDSVVIIKVISSTWHQVALKAEWKFAKNMRLQFGPVYNVLTSKTGFNNLSDPLQLTEFELSMLGNHMHPLYTIKDEIGNRAGTLLKTWIGLQAGIYINLEFSK